MRKRILFIRKCLSHLPAVCDMRRIGRFSCPAPQYFKIDLTCYKCSDTIEHCIACSDATKCTECESPYVVSDTGDSCIEPPTCATAAMQNNTNVAAATDASSFYAAMDSGKSVILIDGDISGLATTALGSKNW